jgi:hypothetical protein
MLETIREFA